MGMKNSTEPGIKPRFFSLYNMPKMRVAIDFFHITGYNTENAQKTNRKTGGNKNDRNGKTGSTEWMLQYGKR